MSGYSRVSTEELNEELNDEESGASEGFLDLAVDFEDVQWLEFMGLSRWSESGRAHVRSEVQKLVELTLLSDQAVGLCVSLHEVLCDLSFLFNIPLHVYHVTSLFQLARKEDASNQLQKQLSSSGDKNNGFDDGKWKHFLQKWVVAVNQLEAITCIQYIELLQAGFKQRSLTKLLGRSSVAASKRLKTA